MSAYIDEISDFLIENKINDDFIGIVQLNPIAGDFETNAKKIIKYLQYAQKLGLKTLVFSPYALTGFGLEDVIVRYPSLIENCNKWLNGIAQKANNLTIIIGVFDKFAIIKNSQIEFLTSPFVYKGINITTTFLEQTFPQIHLNLTGCTDYKFFDGASAVYDKNGNLIARAKDFEEQLILANLEKNIGQIYPISKNINKENFSLNYEDELEYIYKTLIQGIKDYFAKCGLKRAVLGLSGGLDSTVSAVLLVDALGKENVLGVSMPSKLTSNESKSDAKTLAENLGITFIEASIKPMFETTNHCLQEIFSEVENNWDGRYKTSFTPDNIQARSRAMYLWGIANEFASCIPIATSDKSELYMGYATINGDMSGGFATIADVTKTQLFALARWLNKNREEKNAIPESIILKKPGAELAIDPKTGKTLNAEDALMPYEFLDEIIWRIENKNESYEQLLSADFIYEKKNNISREQKTEWLDKFYKRMSTALYKSTIMPPYVVINSKTINKNIYKHPIVAGKINYKAVSDEYIEKSLTI